MKDFLALCGLQPQEIEIHLPRAIKAVGKFGVTDADVEVGKERLKTYYAVELEGLRKILRLCLFEFLDSVLARDEGKRIIISGFMAPAFDIVGGVVNSTVADAYLSHQSWAVQLVISCLFNKMPPILEAAEREWLKSGMVGHCANLKTALGTIVSGVIPKPDLMVTSGFLCETAPKTLDLLHEVYDMPIACYDSCFDRGAASYQTATLRTMEMAASSFRVVVSQIGEMTGNEITDQQLMAVLQEKARIGEVFQKIVGLLAESDPLPISASHHAVWSCLNSLTLTLDRIPEAVDAVSTLYRDLQERIEAGRGVVEKGAPRVLGMLPGQHADPRLEHLAESVGIAIVTNDPDLAVSIGEIPSDPYLLMSQGLSFSLTTSLAMRIPLILDACRRLKLDGVLNRYHIGCRSVAADAFFIEKAVKKELNLPVMMLEWENFDPRVFDHDGYQKRLITFKNMIGK